MVLTSAEGLRRAYEAGVPMGGDLDSAPGNSAPTLIVHALKEADGANLDRIRIVKGWVDSNGEQHSRIYDVALSDGRKIGPNGSVPLVGNTVNETDATYSNSIGDSELSATWTDPDFDPSNPAFYYARVLQIPTPRWSMYDAARTGMERPQDLPVSIQERTWTSPVWYNVR